MSKRKHRCDNCGAIWDRDELRDIHDFWERVEPGGIMPSGQCPNPDCRALCYPVPADSDLARAHTIVVTVKGGCIQAIDNIPSGFRLRVLDFDMEDYDQDNESIKVINDKGEKAHVADWDGPTEPGKCTLKD
jgi:hypothetical protein